MTEISIEDDEAVLQEVRELLSAMGAVVAALQPSGRVLMSALTSAHASAAVSLGVSREVYLDMNGAAYDKYATPLELLQ